MKFKIESKLRKEPKKTGVNRSPIGATIITPRRKPVRYFSDSDIKAAIDKISKHRSSNDRQV